MKNNIFYKSTVLLLIAAFTMFSCDLFNLNWRGNKYTIGHFPTSPVNLEGFNAEFDDYNSDIPVFLDVFPFCFSSNRNSNGENYGINYSVFENGNWSESVNFGSGINSEYDEFRPIVRSDEWQFDNDMMIFSSNRPGGKGGFDLYFVGLQKSMGKKNRLRLNPNMSFGGFLPLGITDTRDQFYRITSAGINLHYDLVKYKAVSIVTTGGGFIKIFYAKLFYGWSRFQAEKKW